MSQPNTTTSGWCIASRRFPGLCARGSRPWTKHSFRGWSTSERVTAGRKEKESGNAFFQGNYVWVCNKVLLGSRVVCWFQQIYSWVTPMSLQAALLCLWLTPLVFTQTTCNQRGEEVNLLRHSPDSLQLIFCYQYNDLQCCSKEQDEAIRGLYRDLEEANSDNAFYYSPEDGFPKLKLERCLYRLGLFCACLLVPSHLDSVPTLCSGSKPQFTNLWQILSIHRWTMCWISPH